MQSKVKGGEWIDPSRSSRQLLTAWNRPFLLISATFYILFWKYKMYRKIKTWTSKGKLRLPGLSGSRIKDACFVRLNSEPVFWIFRIGLLYNNSIPANPVVWKMLYRGPGIEDERADRKFNKIFWQNYKEQNQEILKISLKRIWKVNWRKTGGWNQQRTFEWNHFESEELGCQASQQ